MKKIVFLLFAILLCYGASAAEYYFNALSGDDANVGSRTMPFATIGALDRVTLSPGDRIFLASGQYFEGNIVIENIASDPRRPVLISSYGEHKAYLDAGNGSGIVVDRCSHVKIDNLIIVGSGRKSGNKGSGVFIGNSHFVEICRVESSGFLENGIGSYNGGNITISKCFVHNNGSCGIGVGGSRKSARQITITDCVAENNPGNPFTLDNHSGNGILVGHATGVLIERCEAMNNGYDMPRTGNGPVGIWIYECDSTVIRYCYAHDNKTSEGGKDGGGFDFDGGVTNSMMEYNISANNQGADYGLFQYGGATQWSGNVIRNNVSINDGCKNSQAGIFIWCDDLNKDVPLSDTQVYGNVCISKYDNSVAFDTGHTRDMVIRDNVFITDGMAHVKGEYTRGGTIFDGNTFWSTEAEREGRTQPVVEQDANAKYVKPKVVIPEFIDIKDIKQIVRSILKR